MRAAATIAVAALALAGCPLHTRAPVPQTNEGHWAAERDPATRRALLYDRLDHKATGTATHLSLSVREARAQRLAKWQGWSEQELQYRLAQERTAAAAAEEFLLSFYTADPAWNDLDAPKSIWRIALQVPGGETLVATHVTAVDMDATLKGLFPYVGPFDVAYVVTLPRSASGDIAGKPFVLDVSSALGRVVMDWGVPDGTSAEKPSGSNPPP